MMKKIKYVIILIFFSSLFLTPARVNQKKIKLAIQWLPQAQFAGYYVGVEKGIYKKYGFNVEIINAGPDITSQQLLLEGKADFATMLLSTGMLLRSGGNKIVNVCQLSQKCSQLFVTKELNIKKPSDLNGKKIGIWRSGFDEIPKAFVKKYKLKVQFVPINSTVNLFLFNGIDVLTTMWYNEYHSILNSGINKDELKTFFFFDFGFDVPEDGIYCLAKNYDKAVVNKFVKATLEAWHYAFNHPAESIEVVKDKMIEQHVPYNEAHQMWMFNRMKDLIEVKGKKYLPGQLLRSDFKTSYRILSSLGKIKNDFKYEDFYYGIK